MYIVPTRSFRERAIGISNVKPYIFVIIFWYYFAKACVQQALFSHLSARSKIKVFVALLIVLTVKNVFLLEQKKYSKQS